MDYNDPRTAPKRGRRATSATGGSSPKKVKREQAPPSPSASAAKLGAFVGKIDNVEPGIVDIIHAHVHAKPPRELGYRDKPFFGPQYNFSFEIVRQRGIDVVKITRHNVDGDAYHTRMVYFIGETDAWPPTFRQLGPWHTEDKNTVFAIIKLSEAPDAKELNIIIRFGEEPVYDSFDDRRGMFFKIRATNDKQSTEWRTRVYPHYFFFMGPDNEYI